MKIAVAILVAVAFTTVSCQPKLNAPGLAPGEFAASGYIGQGPQPVEEPSVEVYNGSFGYFAYPGGTQQTIYYDKEIPIPTVTGMYAQIVTLTACGFSLPHYHTGVTELNYVLEGSGVIAGLTLQSDATGTIPTWATGLSKGGVATVTASSIHYAENPGCGTAVLLQVLSGLPDNYDYLPYIDLPSALLAQDATSIQFAFGLTDAQLANAVRSVKPLFAVNQTCLALCNAQSGASAASAPVGNVTSSG